MPRSTSKLKSTQNLPTHIEFAQEDGCLMFKPPHPLLLKVLEYTEAEMVPKDKNRPWMGREIRRVQKPMYEVLELQEDGRITEPIGTGEKLVVTYPGFLHKLIPVMLMRDITWDVQDNRVACASNGSFPKPRLELMHGFRFSQEELLTTALLKDMSGMIGAPTRYGKTTLIINTLRAFPNISVCIIAPGVDLVNQLYDDITGPRGIKDRDVRKVHGQSRQKQSEAPNGITICAVTSLDKIDPDLIRLVLCDEPHDLVSEKRLQAVNRFNYARRIAFGATLKGKFSKRDAAYLPGLFGPVLSKRTYLEAVDEGAVCMIHVLGFRVEMGPKIGRDGRAERDKDRDAAYKRGLYFNPVMANLVAEICKDVIPEDLQTLIFIAQEKQANLYMDAINDIYKSPEDRERNVDIDPHALAMAKTMSKAERETVVARMNDKERPITRCLCSNIFIQGVTFHDVRVLINAEGGGANTGTIQKPGRLAEIRPGKKCGIMIDFIFVPPDDCEYEVKGEWASLIADSGKRMKVYKDIGYKITMVDTVEELKTEIKKLL